MTTAINKGLYWAFAALQINKEPISLKVNEDNVKAISGADDLQKVKDEANDRLPRRYTREEVANHCHGDCCWFIINNHVYDVTEFLREHPGGDDILLEYGGHDATTVFVDKGHSADAVDMLKDYLIGRVVKEDWLPEVDFK